MLISFEIMLNFAQNSGFKFSDCLFFCITTPPSSFPATFHFSNLKCLLRFSYRLLFSCIWDPSSLCVSYSFYWFPLVTLLVIRLTFVRILYWFVNKVFVCSPFTAQSRYQPVRPDWVSNSEQVWSHNQRRLSRESNN